MSERLIIERRLGPRVGRTSLRKLGGLQPFGCGRRIWDTVSVRLCREIGENSDKRIGQWTPLHRESISIVKIRTNVNDFINKGRHTIFAVY